MLPVENRLKLNRENSKHWQHKKQIYTPLFRIIYRQTNTSSKPKIGIIVPGKIKNASSRNQIRRWLIEKLRKDIDSISLGLEIVLIVDKSAERANHEEIDKWVDKTLPKINIPQH